MKNLLTSGLAALALTAAPVAHAAQPARASAPMEQSNALTGGEGGGLVLALLIVGGIIFAILAQEDDDGSPDSP